MAALASAFGTPLYVYDAETLRSNVQRAQDAFNPLNCRVSFAAKSCATIGVLRVMQHCGIDLDAVSEGEMVAAFRAGFGPGRIHLHGNCKSDRELEVAISRGIRSVVADSAGELTRLAAVCARLGRTIGVSIRTSLPLAVDTHPHLHTTGRQSKFGIERGSEEESQAVELLQREPALRFEGVHCHLGSQISDARVFGEAASALVDLVHELQKHGLDSREVSIGGGWAVAYVPGGQTLRAEEVAREIAGPLKALPDIAIAVEPGRALVARAALAMYRVGSIKQGAHGRIVAVDGGMADNPRPSLYGSPYTAFAADNPEEEGERADVVGRFCESGDVLARGVPLPPLRVGDLVCVPVSGAYQLAMASNYNLVPRPAAVMVDGRDARLMINRETVSNMLARELGYSDWKLG